MSVSAVPRTYWLSVTFLFMAGCSVALHMGKAPSALPVLRDAWDLSLTRTGLIVSVYTALVALLGLPLGLLVRRFGYVRFAFTGIAMAGVGALLGAEVNSLNGMLLTRALEGLGWIITVVSLPSLLTSLSCARDHPLVLGIWGAFVPVGAGFMLFFAPGLQASGGWPLSWRVAGVLSLIAAVSVLVVTRFHRQTLQSLIANDSQIQIASLSVLRKPAVWFMSLAFFIYSFQYMPVIAFLPTLFLESSSLSLATLSYLTAAVILCNSIGNVAAGIYMRRGVSHDRLLTYAAVIMGIALLILYLEVMPLALRFLSVVVFSAVSGIIPGTLFALAPRVAKSSSGAAPVIGLMLQLSGIAQLLGAVLLPFAVEVSGSWLTAGILVCIANILGLLFARGIRIPT